MLAYSKKQNCELIRINEINNFILKSLFLVLTFWQIWAQIVTLLEKTHVRLLSKSFSLLFISSHCWLETSEILLRFHVWFSSLQDVSEGWMPTVQFLLRFSSTASCCLKTISPPTTTLRPETYSSNICKHRHKCLANSPVYTLTHIIKLLWH